ncbi:hypothetical protein [Desulfogranum mediterraneum]|uniref:hypothetical protein n=1 Tax=Desulfogranum mediterraneum TaxID=160661 RepID=UPI00041135AE|nr:hypothetical protein [Desulfogranum mediterraneum]
MAEKGHILISQNGLGGKPALQYGLGENQLGQVFDAFRTVLIEVIATSPSGSKATGA